MKNTLGLAALALLALVTVLVPRSVSADSAFLREPDAARAMFPDSTAAERRSLDLNEAELKALSQSLGRRVDLAHYTYLDVRRQNEAVGTIFILDVVGQSRPITFAIGVSPDGALRDIQVMVYREPQGEQIQEARFRRQFVGKRSSDPIALGRDVDVISGATISSRSATYAARKGLGLADILRGRATPR
jgi:electron transport complex protein RnfG